MTIDEAIEYCEQEAEEEQKIGERNEDDYRLECASKYRQFTGWLKVYKQIIESGDCNNCRNGQCEWKPKLGHLVRYNCPHYVGVANGEVNDDAVSD